MTCTGCLPTTGWNWKCYFWSTVLNGLASAYLKDSLLSFLCAGQHRDTARVFPMEVWVYGEGREERGTWVRKGEKVLTVFLFVGKKQKILLDVKQSVRLCSKNCLFTWEPEEGMISYLWLFDEHTNCTGKISVFDFMNGEVILRVSLPPGFTSGVSLKNG